MQYRSRELESDRLPPCGSRCGYGRLSVAGRFLAGDPAACGQVTRWIGGVLSAPRFAGLRRERPDLLQDVLRNVLESLRQGRFDPARDFRVYVQGIAHYIGRDAMLVSMRLQLSDCCKVPQVSTPATAERRALRSLQIDALMKRLPHRCREILRMFYYDQLSHAEIARLLGVPVGTVKSRLFRAVRRAAALASAGSDDTPRREH